jgi:hypothetical protein
MSQPAEPLVLTIDWGDINRIWPIYGETADIVRRAQATLPYGLFPAERVQYFLGE